MFLNLLLTRIKTVADTFSSDDPISISNLVATVMHTLFDTAQLRLDGSVPSDVSRIILGTDPIKELV